MKRFSYLILIIAMPLIAEWPYQNLVQLKKPQEGWVRNFEDLSLASYGCLLITDDGNYIVLSRDCDLLKLDKDGNILWHKKYDVVGWGDATNSICQTSDGGFIITGEKSLPGSDSLSAGDYILLFKTDYKGDSLWIRTYGRPNSRGNSVIEASDGGYIVTGRTDSFGCESMYGCALLLKTDSEGNVMWGKVFGDGESSEGNSVVQTSDVGFAFTGHNGYGGGIRILLVKTDSAGNKEWERTYDSKWGNCVQEVETGGYVITGGWPEFKLFKTDSEGNLQWDRNFGYYECHWVEQTRDSGYILAGLGLTEYGYGHIWLIKTDSQGFKLWDRIYSSGPERYGGVAHCVKETDDNGYILVAKGWGLIIIKTDSLGNIPLEVSATMIESPKENYVLHEVTPKALFTNFGMPHDAPSFYYHCEIEDINDSTLLYHDSIPGSLNSWRSEWVEFSQWIAPKISDFKCTFYTTGAGKCQPRTVNFRWTGIKEQPVTHQPTFEVLTAVGRQVLLSSLCEERMQLSIFDASGRLVDGVILEGPGTVSWGDGHSPGVYFIKPLEGEGKVHKVVLIK